MIDFLMVSTRKKRGIVEVYPKFIIKNPSSDLMIRGGDFYAVWVEERGLWSTAEQDALMLIDRELDIFADKHKDAFDDPIKVLHMWDAESGMIDTWHKYCQRQMRDSYHMLDEKLIFSNTKPTKKDYGSKHLSYPLEKGKTEAYDKMMDVLYTPEERHKLEWAIGAIVTGDSKKIQKFIVLYGQPGSGKGTVINLIEKLFEGYTAAFDAKALGSTSNVFALEAFKSNPLVAIEHDSNLSKIEDNTRLNSLISHEVMTVNEKFKSTYSNRFKSFLIIASNNPVKITDSKSGLLRRLIDVEPSGNRIPQGEYDILFKQLDFELGAIAWHCKEVYEANPNYYNGYVPLKMMSATNDFYNFMLDSYLIFSRQDGTTMKAAWEMYKTYCEDARVSYPFPQRIFKEELRSYFRDYEERALLEDGSRPRSYYSGFRKERFEQELTTASKRKYTPDTWLTFRKMKSIFDSEFADCFAQYAKEDGTPEKRWSDVKTKLSDLDTSQVHYVLTPKNVITIDFDIPDENGKKCFAKNFEAASKWLPTYAELSKSGEGIHLEYIYNGDPKELQSIYEPHIEIKTRSGNSALRRRLSKCNGLPIATISSGLPLKEAKVINQTTIKSEKALREMIKKNLNKEIHPATKPSIDFIKKILDDAYASGMKYDVSDMRQAVMIFAAGSTNQADTCLKTVAQMKFQSEEQGEWTENNGEIVFFDCEVFPNLFLVNWKYAGEKATVVRMINPSPSDIESLTHYRLIGFNCRKYDNHILYGRLIGYSNEQLYQLSQDIILKGRGFFGEAYNFSYTDVYDFASTKQSLKKWEIELGISHKELGLPWDQPVPEEMWNFVAEYCDNDVLATEAVFNHLTEDWKARQILAELTGGSVNDTTNTLTTKLVFGSEKHPQLVYTDLATGERTDGTKDDISFPGYEFIRGEDNKMHNMFRGVDLGFGGYVYAEPGMYRNVALLDVASLHPTSLICMNKLGKYTQAYADLKEARVCIKHRDYKKASKLFGGRLAKYLTNDEEADALSKALKLPLNSFYGISAATFENPAKDPRDTNNIIALRGALFMKTLQDEVYKQGFKVIHIKTDSIKIANATDYIVNFVMDFARKYGYEMEHECTYERICLVNNAVYIAKYDDKGIRNKGGKHANEWTATGAEFQVPYVFKALFSHEQIEFKDLCETKSVQKGSIYLDMNEKLSDVSEYEKELTKLLKMGGPATTKENELRELIAKGHAYSFVGRVGLFCPMRPGAGGGVLYRENDGKYYAVTGTTGYRWLEAEAVKAMGKEDEVDFSYYEHLCQEAIAHISQFGDFNMFVDIPISQWPPDPDELPF